MPRWTGDGVADGTPVNTGNINATGNGDTVSLSQAGTYTAVYGEGIDLSGVATNAQFFVNQTLPAAGKFAVAQMLYRPRQAAGPLALINPRTAGAATVGLLNHATDGTFNIASSTGTVRSGSGSPVAANVADLYLIDVVFVVGTTTGNGRIFYRVKNLTNPTWNSTGDWFYDSGYAMNLGTTDIATIRQGKNSNASSGVTSMTLSQLGWNSLASVNTSTTRSVAESHFMAPPSTTVTAAAQMDGTSTFAAGGSSTAPAAATMSSTSSLAATPAQAVPAAVTMAGTSTTAAGSVIQHPAAATLASSSALAVGGITVRPAAAAMASTSVLAVGGQLTITPPPADSVTYDTVTTGFQQTVAAGASMAFPHTVNPDATVLVVAIQASASSGANTVAAVTYAGRPLTRIAGALSSTTSSTAREDAHWELVNPPVGTADVRVTARSSGTSFTIGATALSLVGASGDVGTVATAAAASVTSIAGSTSSPANSLVVTSAAVRSTTAAAGGGGSVHLKTVYGTNNAFNVNTLPGGSATSTYTWTTADQAALVSTPMLAQAPVLMRSTSGMTAGPATGQTAAVAVDSTSTLTAGGVTQVPAAATMTGASTLATSTAIAHPAVVVLAGSSTVAVSGTGQKTTAVVLTGASTLTVTPTVQRSAQVVVASSSQITVTPASSARPAAVAIDSTSTLTVTGGATTPAVVIAAGISDLTVGIERTVPAAIVLASTSSLATAGQQVALAELVMVSASDLAVQAREEAIAQLLMLGTSDLAVDGVDLPPVVSGPSVHFQGGPYIHRLSLTGPHLARTAASGPTVARLAVGAPLITRTALAGPTVTRRSLTGPEVR